jgi:hypothetical protein
MVEDDRRRRLEELRQEATAFRHWARLVREETARRRDDLAAEWVALQRTLAEAGRMMEKARRQAPEP